MKLPLKNPHPESIVPEETRINETVFEMRFRPNARILDRRGDWASRLADHMSLQHWHIRDNRIDVFSQARDIHCFVGFRNAGMVVLNAPTRNFFSDKVGRFLKWLFGEKEFEGNVSVGRLGVRGKFCTPYEGTFQSLSQRLAERYSPLTTEAQKALGDVELIDIGLNLNFKDRLGSFNTGCGPMDTEQLKEFFPREEDLPEVGLFYDIDYFSNPTKALAPKDIITKTRGFADAIWERHESVSTLVLGESSDSSEA